MTILLMINISQRNISVLINYSGKKGKRVKAQRMIEKSEQEAV